MSLTRLLPADNNMSGSSGAKKRLLRLAACVALIAAVGACYAVLVSQTGFYIPCLFRLVTHLRCPGCGVTGLCLALLKLDFVGAWRENAAITALLPLGAVVAADMTFRYVKSGTKKPDRFCNAAIIFMCVVLTVFGVLRNIF